MSHAPPSTTYMHAQHDWNMRLRVPQDIQEKIESHGAESNKVHQDNQELLVENHNLRSKLGDMAQLLGDTQEKLESLRTAQAQQLQAIQDKLGQQVGIDTSHTSCDISTSKAGWSSRLLVLGCHAWYWANMWPEGSSQQ